MAPRRPAAGATAAVLGLCAAAVVLMAYATYRRKQKHKSAAPAVRMSQQELSTRLVQLGKQRSAERQSARLSSSSPTAHPPPLSADNSSQSSMVSGAARRTGSARPSTTIEEEEEEEGERDGIRAPSSEEVLWRRIEAVLTEYSLNNLAKVAARKWIHEMGDPSKTELHRLRDWLLAKVNGRDRVKPLSAWQSGCPEILGGLRSMPVWPTDDLLCLRPFIEHADEIKSELLALREAQQSGFQPLKIPTWATKQKVASPDGAGALSHDAGDWNVFYLMLHEVPFDKNCERCPTTARLLKELPRSYQHAFFSALTPGTHILSHHGPTNKKLRVHLPLTGTEGAELRVADRILTFEPGVPVVFDDSFEHEAWHHGDKTRIVLVFDIWHPDLTDREVFFLSVLQRSRMRAEMRAEKTLRDVQQEGQAVPVHDSGDAGDNFYQLVQDGQRRLSDNKWWV